MELDKQYNSKSVETKWYSLWEAKGYFRPASDFSRSPFPVSRGCNQRPYVIVIHLHSHKDQNTFGVKLKPAMVKLF